MAYRENKAQTLVSPLIAEALRIVEERGFQTDFLIADLSGELGISEVYLRRLFKKELGGAPKKHILHRRIHKVIPCWAQIISP